MRSPSLSVPPVVSTYASLQAIKAQAAAQGDLRRSSARIALVAHLHYGAARAAGPAAMLEAAPYPHGTRREGVALMIVGAAGIVMGLIIGELVGTILSAGVAGLGVYLYSR